MVELTFIVFASVVHEEYQSVMILEGTIAFVWLVYIFETYLDVRQHRKILEKFVPKELETVIR